MSKKMSVAIRRIVEDREMMMLEYVIKFKASKSLIKGRGFSSINNPRSTKVHDSGINKS